MRGQAGIFQAAGFTHKPLRRRIDGSAPRDQLPPPAEMPAWESGVNRRPVLHVAVPFGGKKRQEARMLALGATKADVQPNPDNWRVLIDPAGHPFCITTLMPEVS